MNIETGPNGVEWLDLAGGDRIKADLFIDCTGFKSLLLEQNLKVPFIDVSNVIPNNMAWATHVPYNDKEKELQSFTDCTAYNNGWIWNIPLWSKIGTGYVFSDRFISPDDALVEFKDYIRRMGRDPETLTYKKIPIRNGYHEKIWEKNVVAIGLAAGFIEPLESTGLFFTDEFAYSLLRILYRGAPLSQWDQDCFNKNWEMQFKQTCNFVAMHYALSARRDTPYWRSIAATKYNIEEHFIAASYNFTERFYSTWPGINCITNGFHYHFYDDTHVYMHTFPKSPQWREFYKNDFDLFDVQYQSWKAQAEKAPKMIDVLRQIHGEVLEPIQEEKESDDIANVTTPTVS